MKNSVLFLIIILNLISCKKNNSNNSLNNTHSVTYEASASYSYITEIDYLHADGTISSPSFGNTNTSFSSRIYPFKGPQRLYILVRGNVDAYITVKIFVDDILVKDSTAPVEASAEYFLN